MNKSYTYDPSQAERTVFLDYLRVFCTLVVMVLHVSAQNWYVADVNGMDWKIFNFYNGMVRWAVPCFVMISGSLFLKREISIKQIFSKYVLRIISAYLFWSVLYYLFSGKGIISNIQNIFIFNERTQPIVQIIKGHYHLWFLPMIAGIYICIPIIKKIVENTDVSKYYLLTSFFFWSFIPLVNNLINDFGGERIKMINTALQNPLGNMKSSVSFVTGYVFYFILGYNLSGIKFTKKQRNRIYLIGVIGFAVTIFVSMFVSLKYQKPTENYFGNSSVNTMVECIAIFEIFKNIRFPYKRINSFFLKMSKWSFGAYLVHVLIIDQLYIKFGINTLSLPMSTCFSVPIIVFIIFTVSFIISAILNIIPVFNKYLV